MILKKTLCGTTSKKQNVKTVEVKQSIYVHKGEKNYLNQIVKGKNHEYNQFINQ